MLAPHITDHDHILDCGTEYVREQQRLQVKMQQEGLLKKIFQIIYQVQNQDIKLTNQVKQDSQRQTSVDNYFSIYSKNKDALVRLFEAYQQRIMDSQDEDTLDLLQHKIGKLE